MEGETASTFLIASWLRTPRPLCTVQPVYSSTWEEVSQLNSSNKMRPTLTDTAAQRPLPSHLSPWWLLPRHVQVAWHAAEDPLVGDLDLPFE